MISGIDRLFLTQCERLAKLYNEHQYQFYKETFFDPAKPGSDKTVFFIKDMISANKCGALFVEPEPVPDTYLDVDYLSYIPPRSYFEGDHEILPGHL